MQKNTFLLSLLLLLACQFFYQPAAAQTDNSLKDSWKNLKKSFHPDKSFIMPFTDSSNEDLQAFLFEVKDTKGVKDAQIKMDGKKVVVNVEAKGSMVSLWNNLPKEIRNRYTVTDRTPQGFILADSYQTDAAPDAPVNQTNAAQTKRKTNNTYNEVEKDAAKNYKNPDTSKTKSVWQQQKDYAEQMRQKNKDIENSVYSKNNNLFYENPDKYDTAAPKEKGKWYVEYTLNGKKVTMYLANDKMLNRSAGRNVGQITCHFLTPKPYKLFDLTINDPAMYPDIRKFEFNKPTVYSKFFKAFYVTPNVPTSESSPVVFYFSLNFSEGNANYDAYHVYTFTGQNEKTGKDKKSNNLESGYFEVLYFDSRENGVLEAKFAFTAKNVPYGWDKKTKDIVVTDGRLRIRLDNHQ